LNAHAVVTTAIERFAFSATERSRTRGREIDTQADSRNSYILLAAAKVTLTPIGAAVTKFGKASDIDLRGVGHDAFKRPVIFLPGQPLRFSMNFPYTTASPVPMFTVILGEFFGLFHHVSSGPSSFLDL